VKPIVRIALPLSGLLAALLLWSIGVGLLSDGVSIAANFSPARSLEALWQLTRDLSLLPHVLVSLKRVAVALVFGCLIGVPLGMLFGSLRNFALATSPLFQLLRMISPLSWMPLAVMVFGVGDAPVYFLLTFAAVWPIMLNTASGVAALDPHWIELAKSLAATRWEMALHVTLPGITAHVLTGVRLAIGIIWIVLVPAEMLGVSSGLGYFILDTRDRLAYSELMAAVLLIGVLGFMLDALARAAYARWLHTSPGTQD
jgi:NitT/TauT family transport system permease protein